MSDARDIAPAVQAVLPDAEAFLSELIRIPSLSGREQEAMAFAHERFEALGVEVERVPMSDALRGDPDYSSPVPDIAYDGRYNLRITRRGTGGGRRLLFNTHVDVVPPSEGMQEPWSGRCGEGKVWGRGACDAKGQAAALYALFGALQRSGDAIGGDVVAHLVVEEENGGNGSLAMIRAGETADACIVLEPTEGRILTSIRGAVWFRLTLRGTAGHSGQAGQTRSALLMARDAMGVLEAYHRDLLNASRGIALFDPYPNPMPLTFGRLQAGNWPASAPSLAVLEGVLGFLPNRTREQVQGGMRQRLVDAALFPEAAFSLEFTYAHDCSVAEPDGPLPAGLRAAAAAAGGEAAIDAMTASCDAWFYNNQLTIPTVVYGPGSLKVAHSKDEHIAMADIGAAVETLGRFAIQYCGGE